MCPKTKSKSKMKQVKRKIDTNIFVFLKNLKSIKENRKKMISDMDIQITCLLKKSPFPSVGTKLFMVTRPATTIGNIKRTRSQSILLKVFSTIIYFNLTPKILNTGIISLAIIGAEKGSGQVKFKSLTSPEFNTSKKV